MHLLDLNSKPLVDMSLQKRADLGGLFYSSSRKNGGLGVLAEVTSSYVLIGQNPKNMIRLEAI